MTVWDYKNIRLMTLQKSRSQQIASCYSDIQKSEGDRGGVIIGHTQSGKPVYQDHNHTSHKDFTPQDHLDAGEVHGQKEKETGDYSHRIARFHHLKEALK